MLSLTKLPLMVFAVSLVLLWLSAVLGARFAHRVGDVREDFEAVLTATLTLLGLLVGFSFSMAVARYDERKHYEEEEANAIGTEYLRVDLLPGPNGDSVRRILRDYLNHRIVFYTTRDGDALRRNDDSTARLQKRLWAMVAGAYMSNPSPVASLAVSGMNDVLNSKGYTEAAWLNRIPPAAWGLLGAIAICANVIFGLSWRHARSRRALIWVFPMIVSVSLFMIADIDSPRRGLIHVSPENLIDLAKSLGS